MVIQQNDLIAYLRTRPRHGTATSSDESKELASMLKILVELVPEASQVAKEYLDVINSLQTSQNQLSYGLGKQIALYEDFNKRVQEFVKVATALEERNKTINTGYKINSVSAQNFAEKLRHLGLQFKVSDENMMEYAVSLKKLTSGFLNSSKSNDQFTKKMLIGQAYLQRNIKLTEEQAVKFEEYSAGLGLASADAAMSYENLTKSIASATGLDALQVQSDILSGISDLTNDIQLQYGRIPGSLEIAVLKAKALGLEMADLNTAGNNLLNIESSIGSELEYQLLSGQRLLTQDGKSLTNAYRMATIEGNANKQAELMNQFLKDQGPILEKNMFARKKASELLGIDEATLARSLQKQKIASELGVERLLTLNADQLGPEIEKLRTEYKGKDADAYNEKLNQFLKASDTRTTHEKVVEDNLVAIAARIQAVAPAKRDATGEVIEGFDVGEVSNTLIKGIEKMSGVRGILDGQEQFLGSVTMFVDTTKILKGYVENIGTQLTGLKEAIVAYGVSTTIAKAPIEPTKDALIIPDRGPILKPAPNDVIAAFRPNDVIDRTLNSSNSGGSTIDYNKLAQAIAAAMSTVKVQATVKTDDLYGATKLNGRTNFS
jgi:hypothetical protein